MKQAKVDMLNGIGFDWEAAVEKRETWDEWYDDDNICFVVCCRSVSILQNGFLKTFILTQRFRECSLVR